MPTGCQALTSLGSQVARSFTGHKALLLLEAGELSEVGKGTTLLSDHPGHCVTFLTEHLLPQIRKSGPDDTPHARNGSYWLRLMKTGPGTVPRNWVPALASGVGHFFHRNRSLRAGLLPGPGKPQAEGRKRAPPRRCVSTRREGARARLRTTGEDGGLLRCVRGGSGGWRGPPAPRLGPWAAGREPLGRGRARARAARSGRELSTAAPRSRSCGGTGAAPRGSLGALGVAVGAVSPSAGPAGLLPALSLL